MDVFLMETSEQSYCCLMVCVRSATLMALVFHLMNGCNQSDQSFKEQNI